MHQGLIKHAWRHLLRTKSLPRLPHVTPFMSAGSPLQNVPRGKLMSTITISTFSNETSSVVVVVVVVVIVGVVVFAVAFTGAFCSVAVTLG